MLPAIGFTAKTRDGIRVDFHFGIPGPVRVVVESQLSQRQNIFYSEESQIVNELIAVVAGYRNDLAIGVAGVIHETRWTPVFLPIDHVRVDTFVIVLRVVLVDLIIPVQGEQV